MIDSDGKNLIFLVSAPRAGSTMLGAMLGTLPSVMCPPEVWVQLLLSSFNPHGAHLEAPYDHDLALRAFLDAAGTDPAREASKSFALAIYNRLLSQDPKATVLVDKTPRYYHILDDLRLLWPRAEFIWIKRNPLDVVASCKDTWSIPVAEQMGEVITPHTHDTTRSFHLLLKFFAGGRQDHTVSYEELTERPVPVLERLCRDLGLTFSEEMLEYGKNRRLISSYQASRFGDKKALGHFGPHTQSVGRWRSVLSPEEIGLVLKTLGRRIFVAQGYERALAEACTLAHIAKGDLAEEGSWAEKLRGGGDHVLQDGPYFTAARLAREQRDELAALRGQLDAREGEILGLASDLDRTKNERNLLQAQLADLQRNFDGLDKDYKDRGRIIEQQGSELQSVHAEFDLRLKELRELYVSTEALKNERNLLEAQFADLKKNFAGVEADRIERGRLIEEQGRKLSTLEAEFDRRLKELQELYGTTEQLKNARNLLEAQLADLHRNFEAAEADRVARGGVIEAQGRRVSELEKLVWETEQNRDYWKNLSPPHLRGST
jgi:Sulfotransferase family